MTKSFQLDEGLGCRSCLVTVAILTLVAVIVALVLTMA